MNNTTDLDTKKSAADLVNAWNEANEIISRAEKDLARAQDILRTFFGDYMEAIPSRNRSFEELRKENTSRAWRQIIDRLGIRRTMSDKRIKEMDRNIHDGKMPDLTMKNIQAISEALVDNAGEFAQEAIREVYDFLRPGASEYNKHKTNEKNARFTLGPKVIIVRALDEYFGERVNSYRVDNLAAVDRVFHLADGKTSATWNAYCSPLVDAINTAKGGKGETEYFRFECYKNGNLHLYFKRADLVTKLNRAAGGDNRLAGF